jgi:predicted Zn-dependent protease
MSMNGASAEADLAFVQEIVMKACAAGAEEAQARLRYNERVEVDFDTRQVTLLCTTRDDDTLLTVFKSTRKGSTSIAGRAEDVVARAVAEALAAAESAPPDPANGIAAFELGPPTIHGSTHADREHMIDSALEHIEYMAREFPAIVTREAYHQSTTHGVASRIHSDSRGRRHEAGTTFGPSSRGGAMRAPLRSISPARAPTLRSAAW